MVLPNDRHIEVKGGVKDHAAITIARYEIIYSPLQADKFMHAIVIVEDKIYEVPLCIENSFFKEPDIDVASIRYGLSDLLSLVRSPERTVCV